MCRGVGSHGVAVYFWATFIANKYNHSPCSRMLVGEIMGNHGPTFKQIWREKLVGILMISRNELRADHFGLLEVRKHEVQALARHAWLRRGKSGRLDTRFVEHRSEKDLEPPNTDCTALG